MKPELPLWVMYTQALAPTFIAFIAGSIASLIAWRQWKTAQSKVVLDLFERRMAIYEEMRAVIAGVLTSGESDNDTYFEFEKATDRVSLLFGPEVQAYVDDLRQHLNVHATQCKMIAHLDGDKRDDAIRVQAEKFKRIKAFYDEFPKLIARYVEMHQKLP